MPAFQPRDVVHADVLGDGKYRPGVVLRVDQAPGAPDRYQVLCGTGTRRDHLEHLVFEPETREGFILGLYKTTYFYFSGLHVMAAERLRKPPQGRSCPKKLFLDLQEFAARALLPGTAR